MEGSCFSLVFSVPDGSGTLRVDLCCAVLFRFSFSRFRRSFSAAKIDSFFFCLLMSACEAVPPVADGVFSAGSEAPLLLCL